MTFCERCKKKYSFNEMIVPGGLHDGQINAWLCFKCSDDYEIALEKFHKEFIQPERLNPKDTRDSVCDSLNSDNI